MDLPEYVNDVKGIYQSEGLYSPAVCGAGLCFVSCQLAIDPVSGELVDGGFDAQAEQALDNVTAVLAAASTGWDRVVSVTVLLADVDDGARFNPCYQRRFDPGAGFPARAMYQAGQLAPGALVGVAVVALVEPK